MKTYVVTHYAPRSHPSRDFWNISREHNGKWAGRLGWEFHADEKRRLPDQLIYREKAAYLTECMAGMDDGDRVLWLDGDAVILRDPAAIWDELGSADIGMTKFVRERWNSGVCAMAVNPVVRALWPEIQNHEHDWKIGFIDTPLAENVCEMWRAHECADCPLPPGQRGPLCGSHKTRVVELHRRWNEHWEMRNGDTRILGLHMMGAHRTLRCMKEALAWLPF